MDNFNYKKYLAEGKLLKENIDFPEMEDEFEGAMDAMVVEPEVYLQDIINASPEEIVSDDYYEVMNAVDQGIYSEDEAVKLAKAWAKEKISGLAEGRLFEEEKLQMTYKGDPVNLQISKFGGTSEKPNETVLFIAVGGKGKRGSKGSENTLERRLKLLDQKVDKILFTSNDNTTKEIKSFSKNDFKIK